MPLPSGRRKWSGSGPRIFSHSMERSPSRSFIAGPGLIDRKVMKLLDEQGLTGSRLWRHRHGYASGRAVELGHGRARWYWKAGPGPRSWWSSSSHPYFAWRILDIRGRRFSIKKLRSQAQSVPWWKRSDPARRPPLHASRSSPQPPRTDRTSSDGRCGARHRLSRLMNIHGHEYSWVMNFNLLPLPRAATALCVGGLLGQKLMSDVDTRTKRGVSNGQLFPDRATMTVYPTMLWRSSRSLDEISASLIQMAIMNLRAAGLPRACRLITSTSYPDPYTCLYTP